MRQGFAVRRRAVAALTDVPTPATVADNCLRNCLKKLCEVPSNAHRAIQVALNVVRTFAVPETLMNIGSILGNLTQQYPLGMIGSLTQSPATGTTSPIAPVAAQGASQTPPAGGLFDALMQALTQSGALTSTTAATSAAGTAATTTDAAATSSIAAGSSSAASTSSTSASSGTQTPQQAMQAFIQNLVAALQSQGTATPTATTTTAATTPAANTVSTADTDPSSGSGAVHGHHGHGGHGGHMAAALQDLIDQVDGTDSTTAGAASAAATSTAAGTTSTPNTNASALVSLQQSFQNLVSTMGGNSNASLAGFLTNFKSDLSGMSAVGNLVNTQA